jgi:hypothetical protein
MCHFYQLCKFGFFHLLKCFFLSLVFLVLIINGNFYWYSMCLKLMHNPFLDAHYNFDFYWFFSFLATFIFLNSKMQGVTISKLKESKLGPTKQHKTANLWEIVFIISTNIWIILTPLKCRWEHFPCGSSVFLYSFQIGQQKVVLGKLWYFWIMCEFIIALVITWTL